MSHRQHAPEQLWTERAMSTPRVPLRERSYDRTKAQAIATSHLKACRLTWPISSARQRLSSLRERMPAENASTIPRVQRRGECAHRGSGAGTMHAIAYRPLSAVRRRCNIGRAPSDGGRERGGGIGCWTHTHTHTHEYIAWNSRWGMLAFRASSD